MSSLKSTSWNVAVLIEVRWTNVGTDVERVAAEVVADAVCREADVEESSFDDCIR